MRVRGPNFSISTNTTTASTATPATYHHGETPVSVGSVYLPYVPTLRMCDSMAG